MIDKSDSADIDLPKFHQSRDAHDREYLTRVLQAAGGERQRAAEIAGLNRTHLQSLIKRFNLRDVIPYDPKARGRRKALSSDSDEETENDDEAGTSEAARDGIRF